jgi:hypothetical protein
MILKQRLSEENAFSRISTCVAAFIRPGPLLVENFLTGKVRFRMILKYYAICIKVKRQINLLKRRIARLNS